MQPVSVPSNGMDFEQDERQTEAAGDTDLLMLVQYRLEKVIEPVDRMRTALLWEGAAAIASILAVTMTLWFFVRRVGSYRRDRSENNNQPTGISETMPVE